MKAIQFYSKIYDNLTLTGNLSKPFSSIPKHMAILRWSETYHSYLVLFENIWQSYVDWKLMKAIQFSSKTYDNLTLIGNLWKVFSYLSKHMTILRSSRNLSKLFTSIPKHMKILRWLQNLSKLESSLSKHMNVLHWSGNFSNL